MLQKYNTTHYAIILTQSPGAMNCGRNKAHGGWGGRLARWGAGKIAHTTHTHIHLKKFYQILDFFFKSRGVALFSV